MNVNTNVTLKFTGVVMSSLVVASSSACAAAVRAVYSAAVAVGAR